MFRKFEFLNKRYLHYIHSVPFLFSGPIWSCDPCILCVGRVPASHRLFVPGSAETRQAPFFILGISMIMIFMITLTLIWFLVMTMRMVLRGQYIWDRLSVLLTNQSVVGQPCPHPLPLLLSSYHHHTIAVVIIILSLSFSSSSYFCGIRGVSQK